MPELRFLPNDAGEGEGLSDAGIETYRADPFPAVARETGQNSHDAYDKQRCPTSPVRVEIDKIEIPSHSLPGYERYREVANRCLDLATKQKRKKEKAFFEQARRVLSRDRIPVLRVADFNTKGLRGPCEEGTPFHSLVKSSGVSNKDDDTSGGSFGIGKSAVYSASDLQTVFYATRYPERDGSNSFLCQGKTKFMSFTDTDGKAFRSIGYWGEPYGYLPVDTPELAPAWLRRQEIGTTVCSVGVRESDDWQREIIASILINFFSAIHRDQLEFRVDGELVNTRTLRQRFDDPAVAAAAKAKKDDYVFAQSMYECLTNDDEASEDVLSISGVGAFRLRMIVRDGMPKRVGILRNGMYVCDSLAHFGDKFSRFPMYRDFVAIVEPADDEASAWMRQMESPRHDEVSPERLLTPIERRNAANAGRQLASLIRDKIKEAAKPHTKDETDLDELSEFFALDNKGPKDEDGARDIETFKVHKPESERKPRQTKTPSTVGSGTGGGGHERGGGSTRRNGGDGPGPGSGSGGRGKHGTRKPFALIEPRTLIPNRDDLRRRQILFTPETSGEAVLSFESSGVNNPEELATDPAECRVQCKAGERQKIEVRFVTPYDGPIEVISWDAVTENISET